MPQIKIEAPAKLNLHLKVGDKRPDGFHNIESLFLALAFGDTLYLETIPSETIIPLEIRMDLPLSIPPEKNIISRAVALFRSRTGFNHGLKVTVEKRIPLGSGLGGGSSNAAATLLALNRLASDGTPLVSEAALAEMGASLGSDVPFFLHNTTAAWVTGRGETVCPLDLPESALGLPIVLVNPGFPSDTAEAYRLLDVWRDGIRDLQPSPKGEGSPPDQGSGIGGRGSMDGGVAGVSPAEGGSGRPLPSLLGTGWSGGGDFPPFSPLPAPRSLFPFPFFNDFLPVLTDSKNGTIYQRIIADLREMGADFVGLSGTGSTCFGVFPECALAESAQKALLKHWLFVIITFPLAH